MFKYGTFNIESGKTLEKRMERGMNFSNSMSIRSFYHVCAVIKRPKQVVTLCAASLYPKRLTQKYSLWRGITNIGPK